MGGFTRKELGLVATAALLVFSRVFGLSLVLPNFRGHYEVDLGFDAIWVGTAFGAYGLTMAAMQLPWGMLSDRIGRRPVLLLTSVLFVVGSLVAAYADSVAALIVGRLLQGTGAIASVAMAAVGETIPTERRTTAMAMVGIPAGAGFLVGMAFGPLLYPLISMQGLFFVTAAIGAVAAVPVMRLSFAAPDTSVVPVKTTGAVLALAIAGFTSNYFLTTTLFFLPEDDWRVLLPMLAVAFLVVATVSRRFDKAGLTWQPIAVGLLALAATAPWFASRSDGVLLLLAGGAFFTTHAVLATTLPSQVSRIAGPSGGRGHGTQNVVAYLGTFAAGPIAGALAAQAGLAFALAAGIALTATALVVVRLRPLDASQQGP